MEEFKQEQDDDDDALTELTGNELDNVTGGNASQEIAKETYQSMRADGFSKWKSASEAVVARSPVVKSVTWTKFQKLGGAEFKVDTPIGWSRI